MLNYNKLDMISSDNYIRYDTGMNLLFNSKQFEKLINIVNNYYDNKKIPKSQQYMYNMLRRLYNGFNTYKSSNYSDLNVLLNYVEIIPTILQEPLTVYPSVKTGNAYIFANISINNMTDNDIMATLIMSEIYRNLLYVKYTKFENLTDSIATIMFNILVLLFGKKQGFIEDDKLLIILKFSLVYFVLKNFFNMSNVYSKANQYVKLTDFAIDSELTVNLKEIADYIEKNITTFSKLIVYLNNLDIKINVNEFVVKITNYFGYDVLAMFSSLERFLCIVPIISSNNNITKNLINFINKTSLATLNDSIIRSLSNISNKNKPQIYLQI
jgi:hypothetical protein